MALPIAPARGPIDATLSLPGSKSYTNRALLIAALADGESVISQALISDDTRAMESALDALGIKLALNEAARVFTVQGQSGRIPAARAELYAANAGTAARFLTAAVALGHGEFTIDGSPRMRQRPIEPLLDGLRQLGVRAEARDANGCPPVDVHADGLPGGSAHIRGDISSQYFSALLLVAPYARREVEICVDGELVSRPYIEMTSSIMGDFGVHVVIDDDTAFRVSAGQTYRARAYVVEPDASAASYFFAAAAVTGGRVRVRGLSGASVQGDLGLLDVLAEMGCTVERDGESIELRGPAQLRGVEADFSRMGDVASTLAAIAPFAQGPVTIYGIAQTHFEESDRPVAVATELQRMGIRVDSQWDRLTIYPGSPAPARIQTYDDHRLAMSFAITGLRAPGIEIDNPSCVTKTFPDFFTVLDQAVHGSRS